MRLKCMAVCVKTAAMVIEEGVPVKWAGERLCRRRAIMGTRLDVEVSLTTPIIHAVEPATYNSRMAKMKISFNRRRTGMLSVQTRLTAKSQQANSMTKPDASTPTQRTNGGVKAIHGGDWSPRKATTKTDATAQVTASVAMITPTIFWRWSRVKLLRKKAVEHRERPMEMI